MIALPVPRWRHLAAEILLRLFCYACPVWFAVLFLLVLAGFLAAGVVVLALELVRAMACVLTLGLVAR